MNISMLLSSCDKYEDTWKPFLSLLKKHWPEFNMPIYLGAETKEIAIEGLDVRCPLSKGPVYTQWSERLLRLLDHIDSEYILFSLDDFWITERVNDDAFNRICSYMENDSQMGFVCLKQEIKDYSSEKDKAACIDCQYPELWRCLKDKSFRITTQFGIWKKSYLIRILRAHESAWYFETRATWRSKFMWERVYDAKENVITYPVGGSIGGGRVYKDYLHYYDEDLIHECIEKRGTLKFGETKTYPPEPKGWRYYVNLILSMLPKW